jgi:hypothetical protein
MDQARFENVSDGLFQLWMSQRSADVKTRRSDGDRRRSAHFLKQENENGHVTSHKYAQYSLRV